MTKFSTFTFILGLTVIIAVLYDQIIFVYLHYKLTSLYHDSDQKRDSYFSLPDSDKRISKIALLFNHVLNFVGQFRNSDPRGVVAMTIACLSLLSSVLIFLLFHSFAIAMIAISIVSCILSVLWMVYENHKRRLLLAKELPQALDGLIRCLRSGMDFNRSLSIVTEESSPLLSAELRRVLRERDLGQALDISVRNMAMRLKSSELAFLAALISVQERSGGPLIQALNSLSQILKDRERLRLKRMSASAEARMSAGILGGLPLLIALGLFSVNPSYRVALLETQSGRLFLLLALGLLCIGTFVMYRLVKAES